MWTEWLCACSLLFLVYGFEDHDCSGKKKDRIAPNTRVRPKVKVAQGWLEGEVLEFSTGDGFYNSFKGIPYAAPPLGKLRFRDTKPPLPWKGIRSAAEHGPECTQINGTAPMSEDCLFLNVYSRDLNPKTPVAVMVFIHGGSFVMGSGNSKRFGPDFLLHHGVILVTMNYRLDSLGFLCIDTKDVPGNAGLKDQVAALRWVKANIVNFGGDPENITLFGESAGSVCASIHILSPMSNGLYKRVISESGVPLCDWSQPDHPSRRAFILGKILGKETDDPNVLLEYLQSLPAEELVGKKPILFTSEIITSNRYKLYQFTPVVEKDFGQERILAEPVLDILKQGKVNKADLFIGHTNAESLGDCDDLVDIYMKPYDRFPELVVPTKILMQCAPDTNLQAADTVRYHYFGRKPISNATLSNLTLFITDSVIQYDVHRYADKFPNLRNHTKFFYLFSCYSNRNIYGENCARYGLFGAAHMDDLMYLFDNKGANLTLVKNSREYRLVQLVCKVFSNFAKYGTPTPDMSLGIIWPEYNNCTRLYVNIGDNLTIGSNYKQSTFDFWKYVFNRAGVEY